MRELLIIALALLMPICISWLKDRGWPDSWKVLLSLGVSVLAGAGISLLEARLDAAAIIATGALVFSGATIFYKAWFQHSRLNQWLEGDDEPPPSQPPRS